MSSSLLLLSAMSCLLGTSHSTATSNGAQVRAGYWLLSSEHYYPLSRINTSLYTHLYFHSISLYNLANFTIASLPNGTAQLPLSSFSPTLKSRDPSLKTLLSISGESWEFSSMASNAASRAAFINSSAGVAKANLFDGLDLAWEYPSSVSDMANYGVLLGEMRTHVNEANGPRLLLTATVYFSDHIFDGSPTGLDYPIKAIGESLDWVNAICYNYHKKGSSTTAANAALYNPMTHLSSSYGIVSWLDAGLPPDKLLMGIPVFGRSWFLKNKLKNGTGATAVADGPRQKLSNHTGIMGYFEIQRFLKQNNIESVYDSKKISAYFQAGDLWVSFDSTEVVEEKIAFIYNNWLPGYFLWPISYDDENFTISTTAAETWLKLISATEPEDGSNSTGHDFYRRSPPPETMAEVSPAAYSRLPSFHFQMSCFLLMFILQRKIINL